LSNKKSRSKPAIPVAKTFAVVIEKPAPASLPITVEKTPSHSLFSNQFVLGTFLLLLVLLAFLPALKNGFVNYDDPAYVLKNPHVQSGLNWASLHWAFHTFESSNWHPLTWISHMADCRFYGLKPWGHHLTNVLLHAANTLLLFFLLSRMTGAMWRSFFVAAFFGLHPLRVESVAWISELKDVLSLFFGLLTLCFYTIYARHRGVKSKIFYGMSIACFIAGLLSKPMLVTLPFVLLLLDYWPLQRTGASQENAPSNSTVWLKLILEKIPFLLLSIASSVITFIAQQRGGAVKTIVAFPLLFRLENTFVSYLRYVGKIFYPAGLSIFYPYPGHWPALILIAALIFLCGLSFSAFKLRQAHPWFFVGWFWFLGTLLPVIGLVQVGEQSIADRYTMLPSIGIAIIVVWGAMDVLNHWRSGKTLGVIMGSAAIGICILVTRTQIGYWRNSETLFRHAIAAGAGGNYVVHMNLAGTLIDQNELDEGITEYRTATSLNPNLWMTHKGLGIALHKAGKLHEAEDELQKALLLNQADAEAHSELGWVYSATSRPEQALTEFQHAVTLNPESSGFHYNLGYEFYSQGRLDNAIVEFQKSLDLDPNNPMSRLGIGNTYLRQNRLEPALKELKDASLLNPNDPAVHVALAKALQGQGRLDEAVVQLETAAKLNPNDAVLHNQLGVSYAQKGNLDLAMSQFQEAASLDPNLPEAHKNLAMAFAAKGRTEEAITQVKAALALRPNYPAAQALLRSLASPARP
jgi:tetratricopeptide (TPR) repeat protein